MRVNAGFAFGFLVLVFLAGAQRAVADTWTCRMTENTQSGFVAETVILALHDDSGTVKVRDAITEKYRDGWLRASVDFENSKRIIIAWKLAGVRNPPMEPGSSTTNIFYSFSIQKSDGSAKVHIQSIPGGTVLGPVYSGVGRCTATD